jgi:hypothetical protein
VLKKKQIYGSDRVDSDSESGSSSLRETNINDAAKEGLNRIKGGQIWFKPINSEIKLIDFGGATYEEEHHTQIINTR